MLYILLNVGEIYKTRQNADQKKIQGIHLYEFCLLLFSC